MKMHRGDESIVLDGHPGLAFDHPRVDDVLAGITFHLTQQRRDRHGATGDHRLHVSVDEIGELLAVVTKEGANFGHDTASRKRWLRIGGRYQCGTTRTLVEEGR